MLVLQLQMEPLQLVVELRLKLAKMSMYFVVMLLTNLVTMDLNDKDDDLMFALDSPVLKYDGLAAPLVLVTMMTVEMFYLSFLENLTNFINVMTEVLTNHRKMTEVRKSILRSMKLIKVEQR